MFMQMFLKKITVGFWVCFGMLAGSIQAAEVGNISAEEVGRVQTRVKSKNFRTLGFGPGKFQNMDEDAMAYSLSYGYLWDVQVQAALRLAADVAAVIDDEITTFASGNLGVLYYFSTSDISPLVLGELGLGGASTSKDDIDSLFGFTLGGGLGLALFRTSDTQLQILGQYRTLLKSNDDGIPATYNISLNLLF